MTSYRISNRTSAEIVVEDIGISLPPKGSRIVSSHQFDSSKDLKKLSTWIRSERIHEPAPRPQSVSPDPTPAPPEPPPLPVYPAPSPGITQDEAEAMHATMREMSEKMSQMVELLARAPTSVFVPAPQHFTAASQNDLGRPSVAPAEGPIYVPSGLVPKVAESRISVKESESSDDGFDSAAEALRNLRRKK